MNGILGFFLGICGVILFTGCKKKNKLSDVFLDEHNHRLFTIEATMTVREFVYRPN